MERDLSRAATVWGLAAAGGDQAAAHSLAIARFQGHGVEVRWLPPAAVVLSLPGHRPQGAGRLRAACSCTNL